MKRSYKNTINNVTHLLLKNIIFNVYYYPMYQVLFQDKSLIPQKSNFGREKGCGKRASSPPLELKRDNDIGNCGTIKLTNLGF
jgi:hypothetical protein